MDVVVVRLSQNGDVVAQRRFGDASSQIPFAAASVGGDLVIAGGFQGTLDLGATSLESSGEDDVFVMRLDAALDPVWARRFGSASGSDSATSVAVDPSGDVVIAGTFEGTVSFDGVDVQAVDGVDLFVAKLQGD
jgi:hypothetical protein